MNSFLLANSKESVDFFVEKNAFSGVKKVASKVIGDFTDITGIEKNLNEIDITSLLNLKMNNAVIFATVGNSKVLDFLQGKELIDLSEVKGKWEVFAHYLVKIEGVVDNLLVIAGSDKLGTIYGSFDLSKKMGVSPLKYFTDAALPKVDTANSDFCVSLPDTFVSKVPSVKFRGFFINDEWPCYGNWTMDHFGGFTAKMYDHVFELLLRLNGNYLWPAMWSSSFALDGPGLLSYELADEYGIYIGNSHHEPCLRAGEEYSKVRGKGSIYGDAWNFHTNTEGITRFWRDSMNERGGFTSVVTVGMRGEADSKILGENATLKDNIDLLKKVIKCQNEIIKEAEEKFNKKFPKMLALYKEVEPFYYGDENTEGLCDWDELSDTIMMLCEDNHGYNRTLPDDKMRKHKGGFGMYYHVDYHGSPISYEWINSTPLSKIWEQMSQAFDYGVRDLWILNVGDLKHNEFPLSYFMNLAYDFEKWGTNSINTTFDYTKEAIKLLFGNNLSDELVNEAAEILTETVRILALRRPEALNPKIYHPCNYNESSNLLARVEALVKREREFSEKLSGDCLDTWYSLSGFQTKAGANLVKMMLASGKNELLAGEGRKKANEYADMVNEAIKLDESLKHEFVAFKSGKWAGMELAPHIGFTKWNEDGNRYPVKMYVEPVNHPRMFVLREDDDRVYDKIYGSPMELVIDDFCYDGFDLVNVIVANTGTGSLTYSILGDVPSWLSISSMGNTVSDEEVITFKCDKSKLEKESETVFFKITDKDTTVSVKVSCKAKTKASKGANLQTPSGFSINATDYSEVFAPKDVTVETLNDYGIYGSAIKAYPTLISYAKGNEPKATYDLFAEKSGTYTLELVSAPVNPLNREAKLEVGIMVNDGDRLYQNTVPSGYKSGEGSDMVWSLGSLNHRRTTKWQIELKEGLNKVSVLMPDPGYVLLKLFVYDSEPKASYLGMPTGFRV